jgi:hypothetical protein
MNSRGLAIRLLILAALPTLVMLPIIAAFYCFALGDGDVPPKIANLHAWLSGHSNFWLKNLEGGTLQVGTTSNPMTLLDVLFLWFEPHVASNITQLFEVTLGGIGFFLWRFFQRKQSQNAALLGAVTYELCHFALARLSTGHEIVTIQHGVFPWTLWLIDRLAQGHWRTFIFVFPWLFFQMALSGVPQQTIPLVLIMGLYLLFCLKEQNKEMVKPVLILVGCLALGLAFAAFVYYPGFAFSRFSVPPGTPEYNIKDYKYHISYPWVAVIQFICPYFFGEDVTMKAYATYFSPENTGSFYEFAIYGGFFSALVPFVFWNKFKQSREMLFWLACGVGLLLISVGKWGGVYILIAKLPIMANLRGPARFLIAMPVVLCVFASFGMECLEKLSLKEVQRIWKKLYFIVISVIIFSVLYWMAAQYSWENVVQLNGHLQFRLKEILLTQVRPAAWLNLKQMCLVALVFLAAMRLGFLDKRRAILALICFQVAELVINAYPLMNRSGGVYRCYTEQNPYTGIIHSLTDKDESRFVDAADVRPPLISMLDGTRPTATYRNLHLRWYLELIYAAEGKFGIYDTYDYAHRNAESPISRLMRVSTVLSRKNWINPEWNKMCTIDDVNVYHRKNIPPPFYFAKSIKVEPDRLARLKALSDMNRDSLSECLIESSIPAASSISVAPIQSIVWQDKLEAHVKWDKPTQGIICTDITYYPNWKASDKNGALQTIRVNHGFLGIVTRADTTEMDVMFDPKEHRIGIKISLSALGAWILISGVLIFTRKSSAKS